MIWHNQFGMVPLNQSQNLVVSYRFSSSRLLMYTTGSSLWPFDLSALRRFYGDHLGHQYKTEVRWDEQEEFDSSAASKKMGSDELTKEIKLVCVSVETITQISE